MKRFYWVAALVVTLFGFGASGAMADTYTLPSGFDVGTMATAVLGANGATIFGVWGLATVVGVIFSLAVFLFRKSRIRGG